MVNEFLITLFSSVQARRQRVIFGLLKRRLTVSTEYWGLRYNLLTYVGLFPHLDQHIFDQQIAQFVEQALLIEIGTDTNQFLLTDKGQAAKQAYQAKHYQIQYMTIATQPLSNVRDFQQAFWLANQVISESAYQNKRYYPLQVDLQTKNLVKRWYRKVYQNDIISEWVTGITEFLKQLPPITANQLAATWVGHQTPGLNLEQLGLPTVWTAIDFYLWELDLFAYWQQFLSQKQDNKQALVTLWQLTQRQTFLSPGIQTTVQQVYQGVSMTTISQQRHLKIGTVREHLLTAAIRLPKQNFPYDLFLTRDVVAYLQNHLDGSIDEWRFTDVRTSDDPLEFFLFRLYEIYLTKKR